MVVDGIQRKYILRAQHSAHWSFQGRRDFPGLSRSWGIECNRDKRRQSSFLS